MHLNKTTGKQNNVTFPFKFTLRFTLSFNISICCQELKTMFQSRGWKNLPDLIFTPLWVVTKYERRQLFTAAAQISILFCTTHCCVT